MAKFLKLFSSKTQFQKNPYTKNIEKHGNVNFFKGIFTLKTYFLYEINLYIGKLSFENAKTHFFRNSWRKGAQNKPV